MADQRWELFGPTIRTVTIEHSDGSYVIQSVESDINHSLLVRELWAHSHDLKLMAFYVCGVHIGAVALFGFYWLANRWESAINQLSHWLLHQVRKYSHGSGYSQDCIDAEVILNQRFTMMLIEHTPAL
ncbi:MAG: hypothetical protein V7677_19360 [Motiliproteus sp.]